MTYLQIGALLAFVVCFSASIYFARREVKKAEQLANLRREIERQAKERERAQSIINNVNSLSDSDVSDRLQNLSSKQH